MSAKDRARRRAANQRKHQKWIKKHLAQRKEHVDEGGFVFRPVKRKTSTWERARQWMRIR